MARRSVDSDGAPVAELSDKSTAADADDKAAKGAGREAAGKSASSRAERPTKSPEKPSEDDAERGAEADEGDKKGWFAAAKSTIMAHPLITIAIVLVLLAAIVGGVIYWLYARQYESTDDAYIDARTVAISAQVSGQVVDLPVTDNELVEPGGILLKIDQRNYRAALDQAKAQVEQAKADIESLTAQIAAQQDKVEQSQKSVTQAKAALLFSEQQNARFQKLYEKGAGTRENAQQTQSDLVQKQAALSAAQSATSAAQRQIAVLQAQRKQAEAQRDQAKAQVETAEANFARTVIRAPVEGYATEIKTAAGSYAQAGQTLMMFVPQKVWVTANFKETQLDLMRVGQPVSIHIDAYPDRDFKGHVASIQAGSGAAFSLLPPENATGNFVKIVQRVPVKITFDKPLPVYAGPGMSVEPDVKVR